MAKTPEFKSFVRDVAMHVAAANPQYLSREEVPADVLEKEREILRAQARNEGKPEKIIERMVEGRVEKFYKDNCLLDQQFVKDPDMTIAQYVTDRIQKTGENVKIRRFVRYEMGEGLTSARTTLPRKWPPRPARRKQEPHRGRECKHPTVSFRPQPNAQIGKGVLSMQPAYKRVLIKLSGEGAGRKPARAFPHPPSRT